MLFSRFECCSEVICDFHWCGGERTLLRQDGETSAGVVHKDWPQTYTILITPHCFIGNREFGVLCDTGHTTSLSSVVNSLTCPCPMHNVFLGASSETILSYSEDTRSNIHHFLWQVSQ